MTDTNNERLRGTLSTARSGTGFVRFELVEGDEVREDLVIPKPHLNGAFNGDTVEVELLKEPFFGKVAGRIVEIITPGKRTYTGVISKGPQQSFFFTPDDARLYTDVFIPGKYSKDAQIGDKVFIEIIEWDKKQKNPTGKVLEVLGKQGEHEAEMRGILVARGIDYSFPGAVEQESQKIGNDAANIFKAAENDPNRRDLRELPTCTIDPADAKDFDDALSVRFLESGDIEVGVHIADVSHYVTPNTTLDKEARKRAFSVYLVDRTIPMLPEVLSNNLCSLMPNVDRLAFTGLFVISKDGVVKDKWFGKSLIHSDKRFAYEEAQAIIDAGEGEFVKELTELNRLSKIFRDKRFQNGAIEFADSEIKFELDENNKPIGVYEKIRLDAHKLVEEFMLLKNRLVAEEVEKFKKTREIDLPFMYRSHDFPNKERIEALAEFLSAVGFDIPRESDLADPRVINKIISDVKGTHMEDLVSAEMLRSMAKAKYSVKDAAHFGLGFKHYCHFTSPIRRYPDLIAHRLMERYLKNENVKPDEWNLYEGIALHASNREIEVMDAERESIKYKQVEYLTDRIGQEFDAVVSGVTESGIFVEELATKAQGLIRFRSMAGDTFTLDRKTYSATGAATGREFRLGQDIKVRLISTDLDRKMIDFELVQA